MRCGAPYVEYMALFIEHMALFMEYRALFIVFHTAPTTPNLIFTAMIGLWSLVDALSLKHTQIHTLSFSFYLSHTHHLSLSLALSLSLSVSAHGTVGAVD